MLFFVPRMALFGECHQCLHWWHLDMIECSPKHRVQCRAKWTCVHTRPGALTSPWILPRAKKVSTGHFFTLPSARPPSSNPSSSAKRKLHPSGVVFCWQRVGDSNPRKRSQSPVCYRYTNPLCGRHGYYYTHQGEKVKNFFPFFREFFNPSATGNSLPGNGALYTSAVSQGKGRPFKTQVLI